MQDAVIIGMVGPSGSGKTTACSHLERRYAFTRIHVAAPVKRAFCELTGLGGEFCEQPLIEEPHLLLAGRTPRDMLERLGTAIHNIAPEVVPLAADRRIRRLLEVTHPRRILVDGLRRETEGQMVHNLGGRIIRMVGTEIDPNKPCDVSQEAVAHDFSLAWAPTKEELHRQIDEIMATLGVHPDGVRWIVP